MNKKTNKKGFTLVELVIVSMIMVAIMGAILNFVQPINRFYKRTQYNADANDIGNLVMNALETETRFSTNMTVLEGYEGVPRLVNGYLVDNSGIKSSSSAYTDVIIIDNHAVRGAQFATYDPDSSPAHRKQARGVILKAHIEGSEIDFSTLRVLGQGGEALYSDLGAQFTAGLSSIDNRNKCLSIGMDVFQPELSGGSYVYTKKLFTQQRDLELVNLNLSDAGIRNMRADYYSNRIANVASIDYNKFDKAAAYGSGYGDAVADMFAGSNEYTYIFYSKAVPVTSTTQVWVELKRNATDTVPLERYKATVGQPLPIAIADGFWARGVEGNTTPTLSGGFMVWEELSSITSDGNGNLYDFTTAPVMEAMTFVCHYQPMSVPITSAEDILFVDCYKIDGTLQTGCTLNDIGTYDATDPDTLVYNAFAFPAGQDPTGADNVVNFTGIGRALDLDFLGWFNASGDEFVSGDQYYSADVFYAQYEPPCTLTFTGVDGDSFLLDNNGGHIFTVKKSATGSDFVTSSMYNIPGAYANAKSASHPGEIFKWMVVDPADSNNYLCELKYMSDFNEGHYMVAGVLEPAPASNAVINVTSRVANSWGNGGQLEVVVSNSGTEANDIERSITLEMPRNILTSTSSINVWGSLRDMYTDPPTSVVIDSSGSTITITFDKPIGPGETKSLYLQFDMEGGFAVPVSTTVAP
ncbi:prepilin-type N-terminal cleavage/methylation domain-containing protein [Ruminococcus sp.]|uniref:prepilin-type N-terminal cleavage/methylation domain-containing protein n=1 Tax=Ruminococcus sp. TaxID=41978 RepID=UPI0025F9C80F|nr:prepilin-type N-terminal cleavage/methylation domain-containing protein [Ruminococcus sp.]MBQ8965758.1 prepilin-type N-terminal cleavage/methylation domain-containing protein [Ruminococcus sp.]